MIHGIGADIVDIARIEKALAHNGEAFITRVYHPEEIAEAQRRYGDAIEKAVAFYAKRFAAKEAVAKALGTRIGEWVTAKDVYVVSAKNRRPSVQLMPEAETRVCQELGCSILKWQISLSDERDYALAYVMLEIA